MMASWRTRAKNELEVMLGGVQMRAMERTVARVAGLRAEIDHGVAHYFRPGKRGTPFVGIHGFGGDKETWLMMSALLPRARGVTLVDLPGHGRSDDVPGTQATIRHHAEAVLRVLDRHAIERAIICGNSMGGGVALRLAASWPDRVAGMILVASIGRDIHDGGAIQWTLGENPLIPREEDVERFMQLVLEQPPPVGRAVIRYAITKRARRADILHRLFRDFILNAGDQGVPRELGDVRQRALVIHGEQDRIIDKRVAEDLTLALPCAELVVMRGVGHAPQLEAPRHTARIVERFARRIDDERRAP
jgi:abhydrolase domain-containing protein 6